ncbi:DNA-binding protein [Yersinia kristensenii]|uniref:DNA-binding protein n=1 Tax=Yersinia kristensenii TaxID=28152 RepID=UPI0015622EF7|nr:DNA-binding protein [Yersinia kristensenii]QKJ17516.1 DNA-binding protein [Yersinia kristensenii]
MQEFGSFLKIKEYAALIKVSAGTIYRNPLKFHMFKVGDRWRADADSLSKFKFEQQAANDNNVIRLAVVGGKEKKKCRSTKEVKRTGSMSQRQTERELDALLAPRKN